MSDAEVVQLRQMGWSFRRIASELGMSLGGVQWALKRAEKNTPRSFPGRVPVPAAAADEDLEDETPVRVQADAVSRYYRYLGQLYNDGGQIDDFVLYRLAHQMDREAFAKLCSRIGRSGVFGENRL